MRRTSIFFLGLVIILTAVYVNSEFGQTKFTEAPAGFDNTTNGFVTQQQYDLDRAEFDDQERLDDGLGPVYNARSCGECHQNPASGGISQITELRAGYYDGV